MRVLIVEDDVMQRAAIELICEELGVEYISKVSSSDALNCEADLAILDMMIENDISGTTLSKSLRKTNPDMKVIIYTALEGGKHWRDAVEEADAVVTKACDTSIIRRAIKNCMRGLV
jgi:DNA-binding NarL/FixJ family response regulator